jgi:DNA-binding GntR family transcriptional regulator
VAVRSTLAENVAAALQHAIFHGAYVSGERLVELTIAHEMNVSQNTVRDALRMLQQNGLVVKHPRLGTYVRAYTPDEVAEIYALWAAVESLALNWLLLDITPEQIDMLRRLFHHFEEHPGPEQRFRLHRTLAEFACRPRTTDLLRHLHNQARLLENLRPPRTPQQQADQVAVYTDLLEAIIAGEAARAQQMLHDHLAAESQSLIALIADG